MDPKIARLVNKLYKTNEYGFTYQDPDVVADPELVEYFKENHDIKTDVHRSCVNCQIRQITKYKETGDGKFKVRCSYIPRALPVGSKAKLLQLATASDIPIDRAKKLLLSTIDPVAWAELMFGFDDKDDRWKIRSYQKEQLRCSSMRVAAREGRRSGKTFAMALKLLYYAFNLKVEKGKDAEGAPVVRGPDIMIVTPYQAQLTNIFEEIEKLVKRNIELRNQVTTGTNDNLYIKTPTFKMELRNGGTMQGFVSGLGVKVDGSGGGTIRGQSADVIYLDEMDMIPEDILDKVINPILATTPDTILIATSTPIGKRAKFYHWCLSRPDFKEDYYPSTVLPHWEQIKEEIESESTKESFDAEYMAEFIEGSYGVFRPSWIQGARADYEYLNSRDNNAIRAQLKVPDPENMLIAIGVDWNKNAGTEYYVLGYSASIGTWIALEAVNIGASEHSSQRWMQELIRLNYKWRPDWIYADEGYGHTIIEDLKLQAYKLRAKPNKTPLDEATVRLNDILIAFNFSSSVLLKDPITGEDIKKAGKHFLVENAARTFEDGLFKFPASDDILKKQLLNYVVVRRHPTTNKPVFGMENERIGDHRLDAMMLALAALSLEESVYSGKTLPVSSPAYMQTQLHGHVTDHDDYTSPHDEAQGLMSALQRHRVPGAVNVLKIMRGASEEEDRAIKEKYKKQGIWPAGNSKQRRGRLNKVENENRTSILEGLEKNIGTKGSRDLINKPVSAQRKPRRGRGRSWRDK